MKLKKIFLENQKDATLWMANPKIGISQEDLTQEMESIKYALWLDSKRSSAFFASKVLLVEGPTEMALIGCLLGLGQIPSPAGGVFVLDCIGNFNIHRFMNLFGELRIPHAVLVDNDKGKYPEVDSTIQSARNPYTLEIEQFPEDIEGYLGIPPAGRANRKPQHVIWYVQQGKVDATKLQSLVAKAKKALKISEI